MFARKIRQINRTPLKFINITDKDTFPIDEYNS